MIDFIVENKEVLTFCTSVLGILLALAFGGVLSWRQKICLDYESRRDVAINILRDRFVQRASAHYSEVADERRRNRTEVEEIYKRPEQQELIRDLATDLEDQNRVRRLFRWLASMSHACFGLTWSAIILLLCAVLSIWCSPPGIVVVVWFILFGIALLGVVICISAMWALDGRFFHLVHRIIEPEGE